MHFCFTVEKNGYLTDMNYESGGAYDFPDTMAGGQRVKIPVTSHFYGEGLFVQYYNGTTTQDLGFSAAEQLKVNRNNQQMSFHLIVSPL